MTTMESAKTPRRPTTDATMRAVERGIGPYWLYLGGEGFHLGPVLNCGEHERADTEANHDQREPTRTDEPVRRRDFFGVAHPLEKLVDSEAERDE